jgi:L-ascorbate metabolism protein UlaG (beta-lactamase superfamily)
MRFEVLFLSSIGVSILCEPQNPPKEIIPDIVTFSHDHHRDYTFINRMTEEAPDTIIAAGDKEDLKVTTFEDVTLQGIAASHNGSDFSVNPTLVMQTFDIDGMRIVYIGDVNQIEFTKEQLDALGKVDIALVTLDNYPGWISVEASINLMKQLNPQIMIPIKHQNAKFEEAIDLLNKEFPNKEVYDGEWAISKEDLADGVQKIVVIKPVE